MTDWLIVETLPNWKVDQKNQFSYFGLTERFFRLNHDEIKLGDRLFAYVTGNSSFADIREVVKDGIRNLPIGGDYERSFPYCIDTKPVLTLPPETWVSIHDLKDRLKLTARRRIDRVQQNPLVSVHALWIACVPFQVLGERTLLRLECCPRFSLPPPALGKGRHSVLARRSVGLRPRNPRHCRQRGNARGQMQEFPTVAE